MTLKPKIAYILLFVLQAFVAIGAIPVGYLFITHPDGSAVGMSVEMLINSPFHDFLIPGIALFVFNGLFHLINAVLCFFKFKYASHIGLVLGTGLLIWILVQICSIGLNSYLQPVFFFIGGMEFILSLILIKNSKTDSCLT